MRPANCSGFANMIPVGSDKACVADKRTQRTPLRPRQGRGNGKATRTPQEVAASIAEELRRLELWRQRRQQ